MAKRLVSILLIGILACSLLLLSACKDDSGSSDTSGGGATDSVDATLVKGYFFYQGEQVANLPCFYKFKENGDYYGRFFNGGVKDAGKWRVIEKDMEYSSSAGADNDWYTVEDNEKATAKKVVEVTSYKDGAVIEIPYDNNNLCDTQLGGMAAHITLAHKPDYDYVEKDEEEALAVKTLYANNEGGSTLTLYHNKTFADYIDAGIEGAWELNENTYTLKTEDSKTYTLTVDGREASYKKGDATIALKSYISNGDISFTFESADAKILLECKDDYTCKLTVNGAEIDSGEYDVNMSNKTFKINLSKADEITSVLVPEDEDEERGTPARIVFKLDGVDYTLNCWLAL